MIADRAWLNTCCSSCSCVYMVQEAVQIYIDVGGKGLQSRTNQVQKCVFAWAGWTCTLIQTVTVTELRLAKLYQQSSNVAKAALIALDLHWPATMHSQGVVQTGQNSHWSSMRVWRLFGHPSLTHTGSQMLCCVRACSCRADRVTDGQARNMLCCSTLKATGMDCVQVYAGNATVYKILEQN